MSPPPPPAQRSGVRCPRCDSSITKFCYYNNYSLSQPRHFCKTCRRYWTQGGTLRNIPLGGPSRKIKKPSSSTSASAGIEPLAGISPAVDFQVAGSGLYPPNLSPFGDPHPHHPVGAAGGGGGPLLDLLRGFPFNNNNTNFGDQIYYWKQLQQQQQRIALPLLYGGGGSLDNKDNNYQKNEGGVGPADVMASKPILFTNPHSYHDHYSDADPDADADVRSNGEEHDQTMMSTPSAATTQWLFGGGESSNNNGGNRMKNESTSTGNARSVNLKRCMSW